MDTVTDPLSLGTKQTPTSIDRGSAGSSGDHISVAKPRLETIPADPNRLHAGADNLIIRVPQQQTATNCIQVVKKKTSRSSIDFHGIPRSSLHNFKVNGGRLNDKPGRTTFLSALEEEKVADWCVRMHEVGKSVTKNMLVEKVKFILDSSGRKSPFRENRPGRKWYRLFMKRNPHLHLGSKKTMVKRPAEYVDLDVAAKHLFPVEEEDAKPYPYLHMSNLPQLLKENGAYLISTEYGRIYVAEEIAFHVEKSTDVIGECLPSLRPSTKRNQITVLSCFSATGHVCGPVINFPTAWFSYDPLDGFPGAFLGTSDHGFVEADVFSCWLKDVFIPQLTSQNVARPVVLLLSKCTHLLNDDVVELCKEAKVILHCESGRGGFDPRTSQPFICGALQDEWKASVGRYLRENPGENVTGDVFSKLLKPAWDKAILSGNAFSSILKLFSKHLYQ